jgi:hypothetical protein
MDYDLFTIGVVAVFFVLSIPVTIGALYEIYLMLFWKENDTSVEAKK